MLKSRGARADRHNMYRNSNSSSPSQPEYVRFQLSLLRLLCPSTVSSEQITELEQLSNLPANLAPVS